MSLWAYKCTKKLVVVQQLEVVLMRGGNKIASTTSYEKGKVSLNVSRYAVTASAEAPDSHQGHQKHEK